MTPPPTPPTDHNFVQAAEEFKRGGWIMSLLGGAGMLARMLINNEHHPLIFWIRKFTAGAIVGVIVYFSLHGTTLSDLHKSIIMSNAGICCPELIGWIKRFFERSKPFKPLRKRKS